MKKLFYNLFTAALMCLAVTSCSQEEDIIQSSNDMTTFSVNLNGVPQSRAIIGNGELVNKLYYAVYQDEVHVYPTNADGSAKNGVANISDNKATLNLPILKGETYDIVFWAQAEGTTVYNISDLRKIKVNYDVALSNQESYDAFYNALKNFKADGNNHRIELRRPFAQLNLGTSYKQANTEEEMGDWQKAWLALKDKTTAPVTHSSVTIDGLADTFAPLEGKATGDVEKTFKIAKIIEQTFKTKINSIENEYYNLSLNYLLVPGVKAPHGVGAYTAIDPSVKALVDVTYTLYRGENNELFKMNKISGVPVQRNFRTNIVGELLTGTGYDININPEENNPDTNQEIKNIKGLTELTNVLSDNNSTSPIIYNISGFSTTNNLTIEIPSNFVAEQVTFNINDIKDGATLVIKDKDGSQYTNSIYVNLPTTEGHNLTSTNINLPGAHAELLVGDFGAATVITSKTTLVVGEKANVTTLTIKGGNVEIQTGGKVENIEVDEAAGTILLALGNDVELPAGAEDNDQIILAGTDDAESTEETVYVAQVGDYKFTNLNEAIKFIPETGEIKMIADFEATATTVIPTEKAITLELNGKTISQIKECTDTYSLIENKGTFTITGNGKLSFKDTSNGGSSVWGTYTISNSGTLVIENGTIEHLGTSNPSAHNTCIPIHNYEGKVTINNGIISSPEFRSLRDFTAGGEIIINGGKFQGQVWMQGLGKGSSSLTINGGEFSPTAGYDGSSVFITNGDNVINVSITGGLFNTKIGCSNPEKLSDAIVGGTFTTAAKENTNTSLIASGYDFEDQGNDTWILVKGIEAKIGEQGYKTLQAALDAVQEGETITLASNIKVKEPAYGQNALNYTKVASFTFDLNGYTLSANTGNSVFRFNISNSDALSDVTITLKNGTIISGDDTWCTVMATGYSASAKAIFELEDLTINASRAGDLAVKGWSYSLIKARNVKVNASKGAGGFYAVGGEIVLDNCTVDQKGLHTAPYLSMAVAVSNGGKLTVNSGNYTSQPTAATEGINQGTSHGSWTAGVMNSGGELIINGGTFTNGNFGDDNLASAARGLIFGDTASKIVINDGTFNALKSIIDYQNNLGVQPNPNIIINGGNFSADPSVVTSYGGVVFDEGKAPVQGADGRWTLVDAVMDEIGLKVAFENGGNIVLGADITVSETLTLTEGKTAILNLNGKTLAAANEAINYAINNHGTLTIKGNGTINARGIYNGYGNGGENVAEAKLTIENGTFNAKGTDGGACVFNYGIADIKGGTYTSIGGYSLNNQEGSSMTISDGTITGGIYNIGTSLTISNGKISTNRGGYTHAIYHNAGTLLINGGEFQGNGNEVIHANSSEAIINEGTFTKVEKTSYLMAGAKMTINGGTFNAHESNPAGHPVRPDVIVKGGTFNYKHTNIAEGYKIIDNGNGTWTVVTE